MPFASLAAAFYFYMKYIVLLVSIGNIPGCNIINIAIE